MQGNSSGSDSRVLWIDFCKGLGILLMVSYHVIMGLQGIGAEGSYSVYKQVAEFIDSFNMERFFFLSGIFVSLSYRHGLQKFILNKLHRIAYPYFLWTILQAAVNIGMASATNAVVQWSDLLRIPYKPLYQFWFLYVLFYMYLSFLLYRKLPMYVALSVGLVLHWISYNIHFADFPLANICKMLIFFMLGDYLSAYFRQNLSFLTTKIMSLILSGFVAAESICLFHLALIPKPVLAFWVASFGTLTAISLSHLFSHRPGWRHLSIFGKYSMPIFLTHVFFTSGMRIFLTRLGVLSLEVHLVLGVIGGLVLPILLLKAMEKVNLAEIFALSIPKSKDKQRSKAAKSLSIPMVSAVNV